MLNHSFTPTEQTLITELIGHDSIKEIAHKLGKSPRTIENQFRSIYVKLQVAGKGSPRSKAREMLQKIRGER